MGLELWMGNNGHSRHWTNDNLHPLHDAEERAEYDKGELAYMDHKKMEAESYIGSHREWYVWMCLRRAVYLWTGYWSFDHAYLAMEPADAENIPYATSLALITLAGLFLAWRKAPWEALRYGGVLFLFPVIYYFSHPEPYHMRPLGPLMIILICYAILTLRANVRESATLAAATPALEV
jgi:hypothetical protein